MERLAQVGDRVGPLRALGHDHGPGRLPQLHAARGRTCRSMLAAHMSLIAVSLVLVIGACSSNGDPPDSTKAPEHSAQKFPAVIDVTAEQTGTTFSFTVTISSPYDSPRRYADGWRVKGQDGTVYGEDTLLHDHADEQPFTAPRKA